MASPSTSPYAVVTTATVASPPTAIPVLDPHRQLPPPPLTAPPPPSSRRLPPPCWSHDETVALIDSYRDKWYSLRRGNLKAAHWQDVADAVARRCPLASPPKTAVQCRHKMEKLRKRYRTELQRALSFPNHRFTSAWVHFNRMDSMEKGPNAAPAPPHSSSTPVSARSVDSDSGEDDDEDEDLYNYGGIRNSRNNTNTRSNGISSGSAIRLRIPGSSGPSTPMPGTTAYRSSTMYGRAEESSPNSRTNFGLKVLKDNHHRTTGKREGGGDPMSEMVAAIKMLGEGFVRMEEMKMEMAREIEKMRMETEMKRTEMILESQQRIVDAFAKGLSEKRKKAKRMPSPES
ncbi:Myb/SANT-like DNA-binding domain 4 [Dillenia turbinata]|uniref:Myb/SANT-like DNA-binding domain 4 n=1 Tax=Dillenia turbinata TaxID=194707 RepID=A0AAN8Z4I5_9MAGN